MTYQSAALSKAGHIHSEGRLTEPKITLIFIRYTQISELVWSEIVPVMDLR